MRLNLPLCFASVVVAVGLVSCVSEPRLRYRLTVVVNDNGQMISGSSVREEYFREEFDINGGGKRLEHNVAGEAIVMSVRGRPLVVSMLGWYGDTSQSECSGPREGHGSGLPQGGCSLTDSWSPRLITDGKHPQIKGQPAPGGSYSLNVGQLPAMMTFNGEPSRGSIEIIDADHLDEIFGPGVSFQSASVQVVPEPVTKGIGSKLRFLKSWPEGLCNPRPIQPAPAPGTHHISFGPTPCLGAFK